MMFTRPMPIIIGSLVVLTIWWFESQQISSEAGFAILGVVIGALITGGFHYWQNERNFRQQLRLAALEKRLQAHQEAYSLWRRLLFEKPVDSIVMESQAWWERNCIFLSAEAREAFRKSYMAAADHPHLLNVDVSERSRLTQTVKENFADIANAGPIILKGVALPDIGDEAIKR